MADDDDCLHTLNLTEPEVLAQGGRVYTADEMIERYEEHLDELECWTPKRGEHYDRPFRVGRIKDSDPPKYCDIERRVAPGVDGWLIRPAWGNSMYDDLHD